MFSTFTRDDKLNTVLKSPKAVAVHDKNAWMGIFARYNIVEDPVGAPPHVSGVFDARSGVCGNGPLGRFYDCFIAPRDLSFHVDRDIVCGASVVRDMTIEIRMSPKLTLHVPMHAHYELVEEGGELKVQHLSAHWELAQALKQQMSFGLESLVVGLKLGQRMVSDLGFGGMMRFMAGVFNIGQAGKDRVQAFVAAFNQRAFGQMTTLLSPSFEGVAWPANAPLAGVESLGTQQGKLVLHKTMASGSYITSSFTLGEGAQALKGAIFFEFNMLDKKIHRVRVYVE